MKWFALAVTLVIGGGLAYYILNPPKPDPNTPWGVATAYAQAAKKGDEAKIRSVCTGAAVTEALRLAPEVAALGNAGRLSFQPMETKGAGKGFCAVARGRLLGIEVIEENGQWKVSHVGISVM